MRLIDADALITKVCNRCELRHEMNVCESLGDIVGCFAEDLESKVEVRSLETAALKNCELASMLRTVICLLGERLGVR